MGGSMEDEAVQFIERTAGVSFKGVGFGEYLKDGIVLCRLMNKLRPGSIAHINPRGAKFKEMENVSAFISAARRAGVSESDLFRTIDLCEEKDIAQVILCILALKRISARWRSSRRFSFRLRSSSSRSNKEIREDSSPPSRWSQGSYGHMAVAHPLESLHQTNRGHFGAWGTSNPNASFSKLNSGSHGYMKSTMGRPPMTESNRAHYAKNHKPSTRQSSKRFNRFSFQRQGSAQESSSEGGFLETMKGRLSSAFASVREKVSATLEAVRGGVDDTKAKGEAAAEDMRRRGFEKVADVKSQGENAIQNFKSDVQRRIEVATEEFNRRLGEARQMVEENVAFAKQKAQTTKTDTVQQVENLKQAISSKIEEAKALAQDKIDQIIRDFQNQIEQLKSTVGNKQEEYQAAIKKMTDDLRARAKEAQQQLETSAADVRGRLTSALPISV